MSSIANTFSIAATFQGIAYGGMSCLNSFGLLQNFTPIGAATAAALYAVTHNLVDLTRKQITSLNWVEELFKEQETVSQRLWDQNLTGNEKNQASIRLNEISNELSTYRWVRSITAFAITCFTQYAITPFVNQALNSAVTYLPVAALAFSDALSLSPIGFVITTISLVGYAISTYQWVKAEDEKYSLSLKVGIDEFVQPQEKKLESADISNHEFSFLKDSDVLPITLFMFGTCYGLISAIDLAAANITGIYPVSTYPITFSSYLCTFYLADKLLHFGVKQFSALNWVYKLPTQLKIINEELKKYKDVLLDAKTTKEKAWLLKRSQEIITKLEVYKIIIITASFALTYFTGGAISALVSDTLKFAATYIPNRFAFAVCSYLSITPVSLVVATLTVAGLLLYGSQQRPLN